MNELAGKKVLVTGSDGFIGSHLVERLVAERADVRAFCLYNSQGSWGWLDGASQDVREAIDVRLGDIRDARFVRDCTDGVDVVFHLAALIAIPYSYVAAESFVDTNIRGTLNVFEAARDAGVSRVVHTSTSEVYGTPKTVPIREDHALNAQSPYAATKVAADQLALAFHASYELPVTILRPFNTYGPRQSTRAVLPTILTQLISGKDILELGSLAPKRDLTYVTDTVDGFVRAASSEGILGQTIQLGTGRAVSIGEVVEMAKRVTENSAEVRQDPRRVRPAASEVQVLLSDPGRAEDLLGWRPTVGLEEGLTRTRDWLADNLDKYALDFLHL